MQSIKEFLIANPLGVALLAIVSAAVWDVAKKSYGYMFDLRRSVAKEVKFIAYAISRFENGSFIIAVTHDAMRLFLSGLFMLGMNIMVVVVYLAKEEATNSIFYVISTWSIAAMFFLSMLTLIHSMVRLVEWHWIICYPEATIFKVSKKIARLSAEEADPLFEILKGVLEKVDALKLDMSRE